MDVGQGVVPGGVRVLVLGGAGFIGRYAVAALLAAGAEVGIGSRAPERIERRLPPQAWSCRRHVTRFEDMTDAAAWTRLLADCDVVLNCVGILRQRGRETYERVHHRAPAALAAACLCAGRRLIHVSALGLSDQARSRFLRSKLQGEHALLASGADVCIVRPSLLDGEGGFGARWLRRLARLPIHALPADAGGRIAALDARDLGEALAILATRADSPGVTRAREIELGGSDARTLREYLAALRRLHTQRPALSLPIPGWLARIASHACDLLHWSPYSFGHWELLRKDNCPQPNLLAELLGRVPRTIGLSATRPLDSVTAAPQTDRRIGRSEVAKAAAVVPRWRGRGSPRRRSTASRIRMHHPVRVPPP